MSIDSPLTNGITNASNGVTLEIPKYSGIANSKIPKIKFITRAKIPKKIADVYFIFDNFI